MINVDGYLSAGLLVIKLVTALNYQNVVYVDFFKLELYQICSFLMYFRSQGTEAPFGSPKTIN